MVVRLLEDEKRRLFWVSGCDLSRLLFAVDGGGCGCGMLFVAVFLDSGTEDDIVDEVIRVPVEGP